MSKLYLRIFLSSLTALVTNFSFSQNLLHYWNFNDNSSISNLTTVSQSIVSGASLVAIAGGTSVIDPAGGTAQNFNLLNLNAQNSDASGTHLRFNNPIGGALVFSLPTTGYQDIIVKFATRRSGSGAGTQLWSYSADGTTFTSFSSVLPNNGDPALATLDFSTISMANNNPNFKIKVEFSELPGGNVGNNRFDNFTVNGANFGGGDLTAPVAVFNPANASINISNTVNPTITFNEAIRLVNDDALNNSNVDAIIQLRLDNETGSIVPFDANISGNTITIIPTLALLNNQLYYISLLPNTIEDISNNAITTIKTTTFTTASPSVAFASNFIVTNENQGTVNVTLNLVNPTTSSVNVVIKTAPFSTADATDFTLTTQTLNFTAGSSTTQTITIPIVDDNQLEQHSEYFILSLESPTGITLSGNHLATIYIKDNETVAPIPNNNIQLDYIGSFDPSGAGASTCEIVVHDPISQKLFTISAVTKKLEIINFSNPSSLSLINSVDMTPYGGITSVAVKNGIVAVSSPNVDEQLDGSVVFFDTNGTFLKKVTVGALPDMITFTPDGNKVLTANEGQPNVSYTTDPEGSVSIIDISGGITSLTQSNVTTLLFSVYNSQENALIASGIRKTRSASTLSQDFEPEYITISPDSQKAWVTIQENNAIAEINLTTNIYTDVWALGTKDASIPGNGMDISDSNGEILIANWPIKSYYIPDAVANYSVAGTNYLVTANEGDEKEYGTALNERTTIGATTYVLDPAIFPNTAVLKSNSNAGRMRVTNLNGNTDADSDFEEIYSVGSRSFSIFNADTKSIAYDSGDDFERYIALTPSLSTIFNADHSDNVKKGRSRAKGPEPEGIVLAELGGKTFAFISLERVGGVMVYDITNPNDVKFVDYKNSRTVSAFGGDNGPEGVTFIKATDSPNNKNYVAVANEISGTISLFEVNTATLNTDNFENEPKTFVIFPNPNEIGIVYFNRTADYELFDYTGKLIESKKEALTLNTSLLSAGIYIVKTSEGITKKLMVK